MDSPLLTNYPLLLFQWQMPADCSPISKINTNINIKFHINISNQVQIDLPQKFSLYQYILQLATFYLYTYVYTHVYIVSK